MDQYHEPFDKLSKGTKDITRAIRSLCEEFEAVDWYNQRMDLTDDEELYNILKHNRDEELEHAAMALEWLRRKLPQLDQELRETLFKDGPIAGHHGHDHEEGQGPRGRSLNIGKLK